MLTIKVTAVTDIYTAKDIIRKGYELFYHPRKRFDTLQAAGDYVIKRIFISQFVMFEPDEQEDGVGRAVAFTRTGARDVRGVMKLEITEK